MECSGRLLLLSSILALAAACGDDDTGSGEDAGVDAGAPTTIDELRVDEEVSLGGLAGAVDAVRDERGMWHIYATNLDDAVRAQGYLQARDRLGQMHFIRLAATGKTAEFAGSLDSSLVDDDIDTRFEGHLRNAEAILETLSAEERNLLELHSAGVSAYIQEVIDGEVELPRGVRELVTPDNLRPWEPVETLAIARFQAASLSFDAYSDLGRTERLARWRDFFPEDASDARIARLALAYHDLFPTRPARDVFHIDGFPNVEVDSGSRARRRPDLRPRLTDLALPTRRALDAALAFTERQEERFAAVFGDGFRGSNSWAVHGDHTANGHPILANDPHLALTSPPLFWMSHLNTKRAGGDVDVSGQMIAGTPVAILGFTDRLAWGLTTSGYDVSDVYLELITPGDPDTVELDGAQIPIQEITETIRTDLGSEIIVTFDLVPHHGLIIPGSATACTVDDPPPCEVGKVQALSIAWTGNEPSNEAGAFLDLYTAANADEARTAFRKFEVGGQTLVSVDVDGNIDYTSSVHIPVRQAGALTYDPDTLEGTSPCYVLDGRGSMEWTRERLDERYIPHARNPEAGFVATANADPVGVTANGDALDGVDPDDPADDFYIGCDFARGNRIARIAERLTELVGAGGITPEDMSALQNDAVSPFGRILTPLILRELDRAREERSSPGMHPDLSAAVTELGDALDRVEMARMRLMGWTSFDTPAAVERSPSNDAIADSVATSIFNVTMGHLMRLTFDDELDWHTSGALDGEIRRSNALGTTILLMATDVESLVSYDAGRGDSVLWDDLNTDGVEETRGDRVVRAVAAAMAWLETRFGTATMDEWRWGNLHTVQLDAVIPIGVLGRDPLSIPTPDDPMFPDGYPRHGDRDVVDASNFGVFNFEQIDYGSGPQQRLVVEMTPEGPRAWNALPGGNAEDPDSRFQRNEMERWRFNEVTPVPFTEAEVVASAQRRIRLVP